MPVEIGQRITDAWPKTEALLVAATDIDYETAKDNAISWAKREAYGSNTVPDEADIPDMIAEWIADKAVIRLVPMAKEFYALTRDRSKSNQQGEQRSSYDLLQMLDDLKAVLVAECASNWPKVEDLVGKSMSPQSSPSVSTDGLTIDPFTRALARGLP